ncbi:MAG TPA: hypothetical protein VF868_10935 [Bacteroidia bacterium]|jgi:hypothetical protein
MIRKLLFSVAVLSTFTACKQETAFKEVKVNNRYAISIPEYLQPCVDLHADASFQYQNTDKDIYAFVIDERKKTMVSYDLEYDIDLYFKNIASQPFHETIKNGNVSEPKKEKIGGNNALVSEITGSVDGIDVYYKMGVIETPYAFYQILTWTRADKKAEFGHDMESMIESFKELPQPESELPQPHIQEQIQDSVKSAS